MPIPREATHHTAGPILLPALSLNYPELSGLLMDISRGIDELLALSVCPVCVFSFGTGCMHPEVRDRNVRVLRTSQGPLLSKMMLFLTTDRHGTTRDDITRLLHSAMLACPRRSDPAHARLSDSFAANCCWLKLVTTLCTIVNNCFPPVSERRVETKKFKFGRRWPSGPEDILPRGHGGYRGLIYWLSLVDEVPVMKTLMRVFLWCRPAFYAEFAQETSRLDFWEAICTRFDSCLSCMSEQFQGNGHAPLDESRRPCAQLGSLTVILINISDCGRAEWPGWLRFFRGYELRLLDYMSTAMSYLADGSALKFQLREFSVDLHACLGPRSLRHMSPELLDHYVAGKVAYRGAFGHFRHLLQSSESKKICAAPDCPDPMLIPDHAVSGKRPFMCGSCRIVHYCSRGCQRRHWRSAAQPHKAVCGILSALAPYISQGTELSTFVTVCQDEKLDLHELAVIYTYLIGHRVTPNFNRGHFQEVADRMYRMLRSIEALYNLSVASASDAEHLDSIVAQLNAEHATSERRQPPQIAALRSVL